jgi:IS30 family transposase
MSSTKQSPPKKSNPRNDHMAQRKDAGLTDKAIAKEFGRHRTTVGRALRQGFIKV